MKTQSSSVDLYQEGSVLEREGLSDSRNSWKWWKNTCNPFNLLNSPSENGKAQINVQTEYSVSCQIIQNGNLWSHGKWFLFIYLFSVKLMCSYNSLKI